MGTRRNWKAMTESLVPGGFGKRGIEGMLLAIRYAREKKVPYFGICLGMQTACIEFARNVVGLAEANSSEFDPATPHRVIYKLRELRGVEELGGTMRLGRMAVQDRAQHAGLFDLWQAGDQRDGTGIVTSSIASMKSQWRLRDCAFQGRRPTGLT